MMETGAPAPLPAGMRPARAKQQIMHTSIQAVERIKAARVTQCILIGLQVFMLILFARCTQMGGLSSVGTVTEAYTYFTGVEVMM